jgi:hypothetical protein
MAETYSVVVTGDILDTFELEQVKLNVGKLFKLSDEKVEKLFAGKPVAIQRGVDKEKAIKVRAALTRAGAVSVVKLNQLIKAKSEAVKAKTVKPAPRKKPAEATQVSKPVNKPAEPKKTMVNAVKKDSSAETICCPRCGHDQPFTTACGQCKMDLNLHIQRLRRKAKIQTLRRS